MIYVNTYDYIDYEKEDRYGNSSTASRPIIEYVNHKLSKTEDIVENISTRRNMSGKGIYPSRKTNLTDNTFLLLSSSLGSKFKIVNWFDYQRIQIWLFIQLIKSAKKNEVVLVYHKKSLMPLIFFAHKIKKFKLCLEVAEIFSEVYNKNNIHRKIELLYLKTADMYLFSSEGLNRKINQDGKPYVVLYGNYSNLPLERKSFYDEKKHIVYAGKLDAIKGVSNVIQMAQFLDSDYVLHILGYGTEESIKQINKLCASMNDKCSCKVYYEGMLNGEDYVEFLRKCDIGLCCQDKNSAYNDTSFPSKILSYLANGLSVVSSDISAVKESPFSTLIDFYDNDDPIEIANTVKKCSIKTMKEISSVFMKMDSDFEKNLVSLIRH